MNFINLTTAYSSKRAKETGIRKVVGGLSRQLFIQFLCESIVMCVFAFFIALVIVQSVLPEILIIGDFKMESSLSFWSCILKDTVC